MGGRSIAAWSVGALLLMPMACNRAVYFDCREDEQCSLDGQDGICLVGECAYPNALCPSMYAYPSIARPGVAGRCVEPSNSMPTSTPGSSSEGPTTTTTEPDLTDGESTTGGPSSEVDTSEKTDTSDSTTGGVAACDVRELRGGEAFSCARMTDQIYCWGDNSGYQLGGPRVPAVSAMPVKIPGLPAAAQLATGKDHACIVSDMGEVYCWGRQDTSEVTGASDPALFEPIRVNLDSAHAVSVGNNFTCAALDSGVTCWGDSFWGQTGATAGAGFNQLLEGVAVERVVSGTLHTCALLTGNLSLTCWGSNDWGQLGRGGPVPGQPDAQPTPIAPMGLGDSVKDFELGETISCATDGGVTACWGSEDSGQLLGQGTNTIPLVLRELPSFDQLALGDRFACGRTEEGTVHCWGANNSRQANPLGLETRSFSDVSFAIATLSGESTTALQIGAGAEHACLATDQRVACWGNDSAGQLGDQAVTANLAFVSLPGCR